MVVVLLVLGGFLVFFGVAGAITNLKDVRRRKRILSTPTSAIVQAKGDGLVEIKGRIEASEQGLVQTPFSGRLAVWCRITVQEHRSSGKSSYWHTILSEVDERPFLVDDGSGQLARVLPTGATVILEKHNVASSGTFNDAPPHLEAFLQSRGLKSTNWIGFNKSMRYEEEILAPGDNLYALGPSYRAPGPPVHDGYRMAPSTQLVMTLGMGPEGELILTNKTEEELTQKLLTGFISCIGVGVVGAMLFLAGILTALAPGFR